MIDGKIKIEYEEFVKNLKSSSDTISELTDDICNCLKLGESLVSPFYHYESFKIVLADQHKIVLSKSVTDEQFSFQGIGCDCLKGCASVLICLFSLGDKISNKIADLFMQDDVINAMLLDIYSNLYLSKYCKSVLESINNVHYPLTAQVSLEFGTNVFDISELKQAFNSLSQDKVELTSSLVMKPQKSLAYLIGMTETTGATTACKLHDCENCKAKQCPYRQDIRVKLNVVRDFGTDAIEVKKNTTILEALRALGIAFNAPCNQNHTCGNCKILVENPKEPTKTERALINSELLNLGYRLSCDYLITENTTAFLKSEQNYALTNVPTVVENASDALIVAHATTNGTSYHIGETELASIDSKTAYCVAIDLGSTTIAAYLINLNSNTQLDVLSSSNPQISYGADVISRVNFAITNCDGNKILHDITISSLNSLISKLLYNNSIKDDNMIFLSVCGNTIMQHILCGKDIRSFGSSPYSPLFLEEQLLSPESIGIKFGKKVLIAPAISSFVGGDITCGILAVKEHLKTLSQASGHYNMLIDLGTNGELALFSDAEILTTSTAAGPSLEGGEISFGMAASDGAIYDVSLSCGKVFIKFFGDKPTGICGSGILKLLASLISNGLVDFSGKFTTETKNEYSALIADDKFTICEGITFSGGDIRKIQLSKAAIAAGIRTIIKEANVPLSIIDNIYVGGGFGNFADLESLFIIGLLPEEFRGKAIKLGNTAASGILSVCASDKSRKTVTDIAKNAKSVQLESNKDFTDEFMDCILFPE